MVSGAKATSISWPGCLDKRATISPAGARSRISARVRAEKLDARPWGSPPPQEVALVAHDDVRVLPKRTREQNREKVQIRRSVRPDGGVVPVMNGS